MYIYEYETVYYELGGWGLGSGNIYEIDNYREIIDRRAAEGWRFVALVPTKQRGTGHTQEADLVFEKVI